MQKPRKSAAAVAADLRLPPNVSFSRDPVPNGIAYVFRHAELGELGRMIVTGTPTDETCIVSEISGFESEPMFARRREIFEPLSLELTAALESIGGSGRAVPLPPPYQHTGGTVPVEEVLCERCGQRVALLVFASGATDAGRFEDYARGMYAHYSATTLPTYIIGPELGTVSDRRNGASPKNYRAAIMKVWPEREAIQTLTPDQFRPRIDQLLRNHCG